jgi:hypothetical protein
MYEPVQMSTRAVFHFFLTLFLLQMKAQPFSGTRLERKVKCYGDAVLNVSILRAIPFARLATPLLLAAAFTDQ